MTDLMAGVAVTFLLIAAIFMVQSAQDKKRAQAAKLRAEALAKEYQVAATKFDQIDKRDQQAIDELESLKTTLQNNPRLKNNIELEYDAKKDPRLLTIVFSRENLQFARGECVVEAAQRDGLQRTLQEIFPQVCAAVGTGFVQSIALEGHTDSSPPFGAKCGTVASANDGFCIYKPDAPECARQSFENNVRLSAARAQYVFFEARAALEKDPQIAECLDKSFLIAGRGPMDPIDGGAWNAPRSDADNARNRRVVIRVRVMSAAVTRSSQ
jgi:flagellar motor protein MotB